MLTYTIQLLLYQFGCNYQQAYTTGKMNETQKVQVTFSSADYLRIQATAKTDHRKVADLVRHLALKALEDRNADQNPAQ